MAQVNLKKDKLILTFQFDPKIVEAIRTIPGRKWHAGRKHWEVPVENVEEVLAVLEPLGFRVHADVKKALDDVKNKISIIEEIKQKGKFTYVGDLPLYDFQKVGVEFLNVVPNALLADAPGLGKTLQSIAALEDKSRVLVFCPASLKYGWEGELNKWTNKSVTVVDGPKRKRIEQWRMRTEWTIANYELLLHDFRIIKNEQWDAIVCDEATRISNPEAKTTQALKTLSCPRKIALTGTPVSNTPIDIYSIIDWISRDSLGTFAQFKSKYCVIDESYYNRVVGYKNLKELSDKVKRFMIRRTKEEVLTDFPPKTVKDIEFHLSDNEQKLYDAIRTALVSEYKNLTINSRTLNMMPVKMLRLKQCTNHPMLVGEEEKSTKFEVLQDLLEPIVESKEKAIIFTQFAEMAKLLYEFLGARYTPEIIYGDIDSQRRQDAVERFNEDPMRQVMIMTEAGAYGLNLQAASFVIHFDSPWSVAKLMQREDRAHRIGQDKPVTVYNLIARNTIDQYVMKVLHKKQKASVEILSDKERLEDAGLNENDIKAILRI